MAITLVHEDVAPVPSAYFVFEKRAPVNYHPFCFFSIQCIFSLSCLNILFKSPTLCNLFMSFCYEDWNSCCIFFHKTWQSCSCSQSHRVEFKSIKITYERFMKFYLKGRQKKEVTELISVVKLTKIRLIMRQKKKKLTWYKNQIYQN